MFVYCTLVRQVLEGIDVVYHQAAGVGVGQSERTKLSVTCVPITWAPPRAFRSSH